MERVNVKSRRYVALVAVTVIVVVAVLMLSPRRVVYRDVHGSVWTTSYNITYCGSEDLRDSIESVLAAVDRSASAFNEHSVIRAINDGTSEYADRIVSVLYRTSLNVNHATDGAFDPTVMPLVNAWGFGYRTGTLPTDAQIDSLLCFVGIGHTRLEGERLVKDDPRVQFDFSSIAKGLACDEVASMLLRRGVRNFMVEIGGEVVLHGVNSRGKPWLVSVELPGVEGENAVVLSLQDGAVATSGNYRRYREIDGKRVSHIVDPVTGRSAESRLLSVTVIAPDCMSADAWATALMVMGDERARAMAQERADLGVMLLTAGDDNAIVAWSNAAFAAAVVAE